MGKLNLFSFSCFLKVLLFVLQVHVSTVFGLLQSDIKSALKAAFSKLEGPLSLTDWCKGRSQLGDIGALGDGYSVESSVGECRDPSSMMTLSGGDPLSPSPSTSNLKGNEVTKMNVRLTGSQYKGIFFYFPKTIFALLYG